MHTSVKITLLLLRHKYTNWANLGYPIKVNCVWAHFSGSIIVHSKPHGLKINTIILS